MKIKHFAGYGCVNAVKIKHVKTGENTKQIVINVSGNHERGLYRNDTYDIYNWLVKRFCNDCKDYQSIYYVSANLDYQKINGLDTETLIYYIDYFTN